MTLARPVGGSASNETRSPSSLAQQLALARPLVMGVLNFTPDSFSDGGRFFDPSKAIDQASRMAESQVLDQGAASLAGVR